MDALTGLLQGWASWDFIVLLRKEMGWKREVLLEVVGRLKSRNKHPDTALLSFIFLTVVDKLMAGNVSVRG